MKITATTTDVEIIRQSWHERVIEFENERFLPPVQSMDMLRRWEQNWDTRFIQLMHNRMAMGSYRYGNAMTQTGYDYITYAEILLQRYRKSRNTEFLVDACNLCLIEFMRHPDNFKLTNDGIHHQRKETHV